MFFITVTITVDVKKKPSNDTICKQKEIAQTDIREKNSVKKKKKKLKTFVLFEKKIN